MVEGMDGGQFLGQESRLGGRNDEGNSIATMERPCTAPGRVLVFLAGDSDSRPGRSEGL